MTTISALQNLDLIAPFFTLAGIYLVGRKDRRGWLVASIGSVMWLTVSLVGAIGGRPIWGHAALAVATIYLNLRWWIVWKPVRPPLATWIPFHTAKDGISLMCEHLAFRRSRQRPKTIKCHGDSNIPLLWARLDP